VAIATNDPDIIPGQYIVIYRESTTIEQAKDHWALMMSSETVNLKFTYNIGKTYKGFAGSFDDQFLEELRKDPLVKAIHNDRLAYAAACDVTQENPPSWGLARVSHEGNILAGLDDNYYYNSQTAGQSVTAYILDTGIYMHNDFGTRASYGANFADDVGPDENGHGTHCTGTLGGTLYGIAKQVNLVGVKVLGKNGSGTYSGIIKGIEWVTEEHTNRKIPSVASMSLGGSADGGMGAAINSSVAAGVVYSVASGSSGANACNSYPCGFPNVICVASTQIVVEGENMYDQRATFTSNGPCISIFAPGSQITSTWISGPDSSATLSGNSMACPHVSGVLALLLSEDPSLSPSEVRSKLIDLAQDGLIRDVRDSPNKLLYNGC